MVDSQQAKCSLSASTRLTAFGVRCASDGREAEAIEAFRRAVSIDPNAADAWFCLGVIYCGQGGAAESIAAHRRAALAQPENAFYWYALGTMYQTFQPRGWRREAGAAFREAVNREVTYSEARAALDAVTAASAFGRLLTVTGRVLRFPSR